MLRHKNRNTKTAVTKGHERVSMNATKVIGMTATPVFNRPSDLAGEATAMGMDEIYKNERSWHLDRAMQRVNMDRIMEFYEFISRVDDSVLNLPPLTDHDVAFHAEVPTWTVDEYNERLSEAKRLRAWMQQTNRHAQRDVAKLMAHLTGLQQFIVSPFLMEKGAQEIHQTPGLIEQAAEMETGLLKALRAQIFQLQDEGMSNVLVAAGHTAMMEVAIAYLKRTAGDDLGNLYLYHGGLSLPKRAEMTDSFLKGSKGVLFMSIDAGGTGLHLVPGCNAVVFCLSRPFSPMQILQCKKRVHRIGQTMPVKVVHLIAEGSVDHAISFVHDDKSNLARALLENDEAAIEGGRWRTHGRIVDNCRMLDETGNFAPAGEDDTDILERIRRGQQGGVDVDLTGSDDEQEPQYEEEGDGDDDMDEEALFGSDDDDDDAAAAPAPEADALMAASSDMASSSDALPEL